MKTGEMYKHGNLSMDGMCINGSFIQSQDFKFFCVSLLFSASEKR